MKKIFLTFAASLIAFISFAQTGGIKATVVNRAGRAPVNNARISLQKGAELIADFISSQDGTFFFQNLEDGNYFLKVSADGFVDAHINVTVEKGLVRDLVFVTLTAEQMISELDDSNFAEFDMDDSGFSDTPAIMLGSKDPYTSIAGYGFSDVRFKNRGYNSETQSVLLSGVKMNDAVTGYSPFSLWSGLNEAMRAKETTEGAEVSQYAIGGYNGVTNILANPASVRPGWRFSILTNSALYRLRLMANYASGQLDNGWSYAFNVSARLGGNDWIDGVYYRSFAYYAGVEKKFNDEHKLALFAFAAPGSRGAQNASTQEVYDLMGDNMYNSNWGYQNGKMRNSRVRTTHEPVFVLKYTTTPTDNLKASATLLYRTGKNAYTAMDWYDAFDPRPDYYRNLPSYYYVEDENWGRQNLEKYSWAKDTWQYGGDSYTHLNWDRLYNVNYANVDNEGNRRSKYTLEERRVDQNDVNLAGNIQWRQSRWFTLTGGINLKWNRTEYYKKMNDLMGGDYFVNIDSFAERDFASNEAMTQNDLDYFFEHGYAQRILKGDKYGYDYYAHIRKGDIWANGSFTVGGFNANIALSIGAERFWREGLVRKGLFAGLDEDGNEIFYKGQKLTTYDSNGNVVTSKGNSDKSDFLTYSAKLGLSYFFAGGHRISANAGYFNDAPTFAQSFISPRTRNSLIPNLSTIKTATADLNYQYSNNGYELRVTGFWTKIMDQTDMMSFYDDSQNSFTNFAMSGIDQRHAGIELGFKIPFFLQGLSFQGALSWGEYIYTSTPRMTQTIDNSSEVIYDNVPVTYWASHPIYKKYKNESGSLVYETDVNGNFVVEKNVKHYVPSTPQLAASLGFNYRTNSYWFFDLNGHCYANSYLDMNPGYRTDMAVAGPDKKFSPVEVEYMAAQEKFDPVFLLNASVGKSWYIKRTYNIGFSLEVKNILNNRAVKTGGYEQTRVVKSEDNTRYYRFDSKYFYMPGTNYMLNLYFRF